MKLSLLMGGGVTWKDFVPRRGMEPGKDVEVDDSKTKNHIHSHLYKWIIVGVDDRLSFIGRNSLLLQVSAVHLSWFTIRCCAK